MIVLNLACSQEHRFEGWFASVEAFEDQHKRGLVACPFCNDEDIKRLPSGPHVIASSGTRDSAEQEAVTAVQAQLREAIRAFVRNTENVGEQFPEEARKMHYKEAPARNIRGVATIEQTRDLLEEGIVVVPLISPPSEETH